MTRTTVGQPPVFTRQPGGRIVVDQWPIITQISELMLDEIAACKSPVGQLEGSDFVVFTAANGRARYRIAGPVWPGSEGGPDRRLELTEMRLAPPSLPIENPWVSA